MAAALIWLAIAFLWALSVRSVRSHLLQILRSLLSPVILVPLGAMIAYVGVEVWLGLRFGLWRPDLTKATIFWFFVSALVLFFNFSEASKEPGFLGRKAKATIGTAVFLEYLVNLSPIGLVAELLLQPFATALTLVVVVPDRDEQHRHVKPWAEPILALIGFWALGFSVWQIYMEWSEIDGANLLVLSTRYGPLLIA